MLIRSEPAPRKNAEAITAFGTPCSGGPSGALPLGRPDRRPPAHKGMNDEGTQGPDPHSLRRFGQL